MQNKVKDQSGTDKYSHAEVSVMVVQLKLKKNNEEHVREISCTCK